MLSFRISRRFKSYVLSTKVTAHLILGQAVESGLASGSRCLEMGMIGAVAYVQLLNASLEPKNQCIILESMIGMNEVA